MLLLNFNHTVNCAEVCRTYSGWVHYVGWLWLIAWNVEVHENEYYCSLHVLGCLSSKIEHYIALLERSESNRDSQLYGGGWLIRVLDRGDVR